MVKVVVPADAVARLRALEDLDDAPFLKMLRAQAAASSMPQLIPEIGDFTAGKKRRATAGLRRDSQRPICPPLFLLPPPQPAPARDRQPRNGRAARILAAAAANAAAAAAAARVSNSVHGSGGGNGSAAGGASEGAANAANAAMLAKHSIVSSDRQRAPSFGGGEKYAVPGSGNESLSGSLGGSSSASLMTSTTASGRRSAKLTPLEKRPRGTSEKRRALGFSEESCWSAGAAAPPPSWLACPAVPEFPLEERTRLQRAWLAMATLASWTDAAASAAAKEGIHPTPMLPLEGYEEQLLAPPLPHGTELGGIFPDPSWAVMSRAQTHSGTFIKPAALSDAIVWSNSLPCVGNNGLANASGAAKYDRQTVSSGGWRVAVLPQRRAATAGNNLSALSSNLLNVDGGISGSRGGMGESLWFPSSYETVEGSLSPWRGDSLYKSSVLAAAAAEAVKSGSRGAAARYLARSVDPRERDARQQHAHAAALERIEAMRRKVLAHRVAAAAERKREVAEREAHAQLQERQRRMLVVVAGAFRAAALAHTAKEVEHIKRRRAIARAMERSAKQIQRRWRMYYLAAFLTANRQKLQPMLQLGKRWLLRMRHKRKHTSRAVLLTMLRDTNMASRVGGALTRFRRCYYGLIRSARTFIACRRARVLAFMLLWHIDEVRLRGAMMLQAKEKQALMLRVAMGFGGPRLHLGGVRSGSVPKELEWVVRVANHLATRRRETAKNLLACNAAVQKLRAARGEEALGDSIDIEGMAADNAGIAASAAAAATAVAAGKRSGARGTSARGLAASSGSQASTPLGLWIKALHDAAGDSDLTPFAVKLQTIEHHLRSERRLHARALERDRHVNGGRPLHGASHGRVAGVIHARALLREGAEGLQRALAETASTSDLPTMRLYTGAARERFAAEIERMLHR